jgi:hypothetical protein
MVAKKKAGTKSTKLVEYGAKTPVAPQERRLPEMLGVYDDMLLLEQLFLNSHLQSKIQGVPGAMLAQSMANTLKAMAGIASQAKYGTNTLLIIFGRFWGCQNHLPERRGTSMASCALDEHRVCYIEDLAVCKAYKPDYEKNLYLDTLDNKVVGCLYCGETFTKPKPRREPYNMFDYLCEECGKRIMWFLSVKTGEVMRLVLKNRGVKKRKRAYRTTRKG